jgi:hypothetical protein
LIRKFTIICFILVIILSISISAKGAEGLPKKSKSDKSTLITSKYTKEDFLREKKLCETRAADFTKLRYSYTKTPDYKHFFYNFVPLVFNDMNIEFGGSNYALAISKADQILQKNFVNINAHRVKAKCYEILNNKKKAEFHTYIYKGLIKSILSSGNGKTKEKAFIVIDVAEEYIVLDAMKLKSKEYKLLEEKGHYYDQVIAANPKIDRNITLFFNVDIPYNIKGKRSVIYKDRDVF